MNKLIECVPNISEGRRPEVVAECVGAVASVEGVKVLHFTSDYDHNRTVKFTLGGAPWLGIWAKPGAPYVCIEPWCGVNDSQIKKADFSEKDGINSIGKGESWNFTWTAEFSE